MPSSEPKRAKRAYTSLSDDDYQRLRYWAQKRNQTVSDYVRDAIEFRIAYENKDYDLPTAEVQRLNQLVDAVVALERAQGHLEHVVTSGFESLIGLTRGNNYLESYGEEGPE